MRDDRQTQLFEVDQYEDRRHADYWDDSWADLLPNPPKIYGELLPIIENGEPESDNLLPIIENGEQIKNSPAIDESDLVTGMLVPVGTKIIVRGSTYILTFSKTLKPIPTSTGNLEIKPRQTKKGVSLYLYLRWREFSRKQRSHYFGKVIKIS